MSNQEIKKGKKAELSFLGFKHRIDRYIHYNLDL